MAEMTVTRYEIPNWPNEPLILFTYYGEMGTYQTVFTNPVSVPVLAKGEG